MKYTCILFVLMITSSCNNAPAPVVEENEQKTTAPQPDLTEDSLPSFDSSLFVQQTLDEQVQLALFKKVMKETRPRKLFDMKGLDHDKLLISYRHFLDIFHPYADSADDRYTAFFDQLFEKMEDHEQKLTGTDSVDVRTKLEIARIKSEIHTEFARQKTRTIHP